MKLPADQAFLGEKAEEQLTCIQSEISDFIEDNMRAQELNELRKLVNRAMDAAFASFEVAAMKRFWDDRPWSRDQFGERIDQDPEWTGEYAADRHTGIDTTDA